MEKIKFQKNDNIFDATITFIKTGVAKIVFSSSLPSKQNYLSGFYLLNENNLCVMGDYTSFTTEYHEPDKENKTCYISTGEVYVEPVVPEPEPIPEPTEEELAAQKLAEFEYAKQNKIAEMSNECERNIESGIPLNGKNYSYTVQDQSNILNAMNLAKETKLEIPYHADDESCSLYSYDVLANIYMQEQINLTKNQTYFNQLKLYIKSMIDVEDIDVVNAIYYGTELMGEYLDTYKAIMEQSEKVIQKLVSLN